MVNTPPTYVTNYQCSDWTTTTTPKTAGEVALPNELLVHCVAGADGTATVSAPTGINTSWLLVDNLGATSSVARAAMWVNTLSSNVQSGTLSQARTAGVQPIGFSTVKFSNASIGNQVSGENTAGAAPSIPITTSAANSGILMIIVDWSATAGSPTWRQVNGQNPTVIVNGAGTAGSTYVVWVAFYADAGAAGAKTVGMTSPSTMTPTHIALEITGVPESDSSGYVVQEDGTSKHILEDSSGNIVGESFVPSGGSPQTMIPGGITTSNAFGTPLQRRFMQPSGVATSLAFGTVTRTSQNTMVPTGIATSNAFGTALSRFFMQPTGVATANAFGTALQRRFMQPAGITSALAFGTVTRTGTYLMIPNGIGSSQALGTPTVLFLSTMLPSGIGSAQAFGTVTRTSFNLLLPTGIGSSQAFGTDVIRRFLQPTGISSGQAFGTALTRRFMQPGGIGSSQAFGVPVASTGVLLVPNGIATGLTFGTATIIRGVVVMMPNGISSSLAFGVVVITDGTVPDVERYMSLVDEARANVQAAYSISASNVASLSIMDLLHLYWGGDFPPGHTYDGSESSFTPIEKFSTMDHHSSVEQHEGVNLNWIRDVRNP
jgi:hypothetical protein